MNGPPETGTNGAILLSRVSHSRCIGLLYAHHTVSYRDCCLKRESKQSNFCFVSYRQNTLGISAVPCLQQRTFQHQWSCLESESSLLRWIRWSFQVSQRDTGCGLVVASLQIPIFDLVLLEAIQLHAAMLFPNPSIPCCCAKECFFRIALTSRLGSIDGCDSDMTSRLPTNKYEPKRELVTHL